MLKFHRLDLTIAIDDVNPKNGWRILGDDSENWLRKLNEEFGAKFTLFIPSNYHKRWPLSENKEWIKELASIEWLELAAHGHYHQCEDTARFGECEFAEIQSEKIASYRLSQLRDEWGKCDIDSIQLGWRNPGWLCSENSKLSIEHHFKYVALHYEHNRGLQWKNPKVFFGADGIHQTDISIHNVKDGVGMIMFQSHIAGHWNDNVWNQRNFEQLRESLSYLYDTYDITPKTLKECV